MSTVSPTRRLLRRLHARVVPGCVILLYHRIADDPADPYYLCVGPRNFEEQLQAIRSVARPIHLHELARALRMRRVPRRTVCVTFDDGYQDNLYVARPLLDRHDVPATVFMTTGDVGRVREFWWDELRRVLLQTPVLPDRLQITLGERTIDMAMSNAAAAAAQHEAWRIDDAMVPTPRHAAFRELYGALQSMAIAEQRSVLDRLLNWAGLTPVVRDTYRALVAEEVVRLGDGGLVDVGGHTVNHPALPDQPRAAQRAEITDCRTTLEEWLGRGIAAFAYPYGSYSDESVAEVQRAGYDYACACLGQPVRRIPGRFLLPRIDAGDGDGDTLARELDAVFRGQ